VYEVTLKGISHYALEERAKRLLSFLAEVQKIFMIGLDRDGIIANEKLPDILKTKEIASELGITLKEYIEDDRFTLQYVEDKIDMELSWYLKRIENLGKLELSNNTEMEHEKRKLSKYKNNGPDTHHIKAILIADPLSEKAFYDMELIRLVLAAHNRLPESLKGPIVTALNKLLPDGQRI
jgi:hypothetical protein